MVIAAKYIRFSVINALMLHGRRKKTGREDGRRTGGEGEKAEGENHV
jgi:hypothetical protein